MAEKLNIKEIISQLDSHFSRNDLISAEKLLEDSVSAARKENDWASELSLLSEQMGFYRRNNRRDKALSAVEEGIELIKAHRLENTVSGGTILLNAATTLKAFGNPEESIKVFEVAKKTLEEKLGADDFLLSGLYNNMALTLVDLKKYTDAEKYYNKALEILEKHNNGKNEQAVTYCNMAYLYYGENPEDERIDLVMKKAEAILDGKDLTKDGYYAFTASKCLSAFEFFGFFVFAEELKRRVKKIYARN